MLRTKSSATIDRAEVARAAYELFQQRGCVDGHDVEDWLQAEAIVRARQARPSVAPRRVLVTAS